MGICKSTGRLEDWGRASKRMAVLGSKVLSAEGGNKEEEVTGMDETGMLSSSL